MDYGKGKLITKRIKVYGIVQGVGFRPLVYRIAKSLEVKGNVRNVGGYVEITASAEEKVLEEFLETLRGDQTCAGEIVRLEAEELLPAEYEDFVILRSETEGEASIIPPDLPVCPKCAEELYKDSDRRFQNPFISCMSCGPRYTIMEALPYDRYNTTMNDYEMCVDCYKEYTSPQSRRFHAQTISCNDCGPYLIYQECGDSNSQELKPWIATEKEETHKKINTGKPCTEKAALERATGVLKQGGILAVKGIGGYHFVCSPFLEETVLKLRRLKGREEKPFAVMFPSLEVIREYCIVSKEEQILLLTPARPIVLLNRKNNAMAPSVCKESIYCGAFLPYTPLQLLLTGLCGPLIMTSANISDQPVIREDWKLTALDSPYLNGILYNTRRIVRSVDDSVAKIIDGKPQLVRRSRGYVPYPVFINEDSLTQEIPARTKAPAKSKPVQPTIFAAGGDLKAAFCLYKEGKAVLSQYFGDLVQVSVREEYQSSYRDLCSLMKINPGLAVCDLHPNYASAAFAKMLGIPVLQVQHHHAHIASVMAEHELKGKVIGVAFDGTGYGTDGNIWGGEFLICEEEQFIRAAHLNYVKLLGGDQSMRDAKKTSSCYLLDAQLEEYIRDERKDIIKMALKHGINCVLASSMGRLFDAVASILDLGQENRYEGECAALLEREAVLALENQSMPEELAFAITEKDGSIEIDPKPVLRALCRLGKEGKAEALALGFHYAVAHMIAEVCDRLSVYYKTDTVALSGGVFQNTVLTEQTLRLLRQKGLQVFVNMAVPPNDGGISLGQAWLGLLHGRKDLEKGFLENL